MSDAYLGFRKDYVQGDLDREALNPDPLHQLRDWLAEAAAAGVIEPNGMCLSTVGPDGRPSSRIVLLRDLDPQGLVFYTNYTSRKGEELKHQPFACICFWWGPMERQVRVEGQVKRVSPEESDAYFNSRPVDSRRASVASPQSQIVPSREALEQLLAEVPAEPPRPEHWGGYRLVPNRFEFWQGCPARFHDRFVYRRDAENWLIDRLAP